MTGKKISRDTLPIILRGVSELLFSIPRILAGTLTAFRRTLVCKNWFIPWHYQKSLAELFTRNF